MALVLVISLTAQGKLDPRMLPALFCSGRDTVIRTCPRRGNRAGRTGVIRWRHKFPHRSTWAREDGELTDGQPDRAERFGVSDATIDDRIPTGNRSARCGPGNRLYGSTRTSSRTAVRAVVTSVHLPTETKISAAGGHFAAAVPTVRDRVVQAALKSAEG